MIHRQFWVVIHRWAGLTLALFLIVAGGTGIVLPWQKPLIRASRPSLTAVSPPSPGAPTLDGITLAARVERQTGGEMTFIPLSIEPGHVASLFVAAPAGKPPLGYDNVWVDPYTGTIRLRTTYGVLSEGVHNIIPFLYRLHYSLALGVWGNLAFGIAAIVWTIDCFIGLYLTLPITRSRRAAASCVPAANAPQAGWFARWRPAWMVRRHVHGYKRNFDLHRAGGLWVWPLLFVFAWSGVGFNLPMVYQPVMAALGASPSFQPARLALPLATPPIDRAAARHIGRMLIAKEGARRGFSFERDGYLFYDAGAGAYLYSARTSADQTTDDAATQVWFDARTGALTHFEGPLGANATDATTRWFQMLHLAAVFGVPYRIFVSFLGAAVVMLSVTGIVIWMKKRSARILGRKRRPRLAAMTPGLAVPAE